MRELAPGDDTRWHGLEANPDRGKGIPWAQAWGGPDHVVFGHDHQRGLQVKQRLCIFTQMKVLQHLGDKRLEGLARLRTA